MSNPAIRRFAVCVLLGLGLTALAARADEPLPYSLSIAVEYGEVEGPARLADELRRLLMHDFVDHDLVRDVVEDDDEPADLRLRVVLDGYLEETYYAASMAARQEHDDPISQQQYTVTFEVIVRVQLAVAEGGEVVRSFRFREHATRPPRFLGENAAAAIRDEALRNIARSVRKQTFKGSTGKLVKKIEAAQVRTP